MGRSYQNMQRSSGAGSFPRRTVFRIHFGDHVGDLEILKLTWKAKALIVLAQVMMFNLFAVLVSSGCETKPPEKRVIFCNIGAYFTIGGLLGLDPHKSVHGLMLRGEGYFATDRQKPARKDFNRAVKTMKLRKVEEGVFWSPYKSLHEEELMLAKTWKLQSPDLFQLWDEEFKRVYRRSSENAIFRLGRTKMEF